MTNHQQAAVDRQLAARERRLRSGEPLPAELELPAIAARLRVDLADVEARQRARGTTC